MAYDAIALLEQAERWLDAGRPVALATVLETWGSAPRRPGAHMVVTSDSDFVGSVSGGCVEAAVIDEARRVLERDRPSIVEYGVTNEDAWEVGLACGGSVRILVEPLDIERTATLRTLLMARRAGRAAVVVRKLPDDAGAVFSLGSDAAELRPDSGQGLALDGPLESVITGALRADRAVLERGEDGEFFVRPYTPPVRILIVGAAHVTQPLAEMIRLTGYLPTVIDPRLTFATEDRFPDIPIVRSWPAEALDELGIDGRTAVVTLSHDPKLDDPALRAALSSPAFYVGALGSRRTHQRRVDRLREAGLSESQIGRIHAPVGLDLGAVTPAEIAVAVLAQIIEVLHAPEAVG